MKKIIYALSIIMSTIGLHAQSDYYWYKGQKVFLEIQPNKKYLLFESTESVASMQQIMGISSENFKKSGSTKVSKIIKPYKQSVQKERSWVVVEKNQTEKISINNNKQILYEANFYKTVDNKDAGLSHLFFVKLKKASDISILEKMAKENNVEIIGNSTFRPLRYTLSCTKLSKGNALKMANLFYESNLFDYSSPVFMSEWDLHCTNDPSFGNQWGLNNTGQNGGTANIDINFCQSRNITTGNANIIIAVVDEGVELNHPDLTNMSALSFDSYNGTSPSVVRGNHGTACAGIIGANSNNSLGVSGIAPSCPIMSISNAFFDQYLADGIDYAVNNGASVISNSWGGGSPNDDIDDAISNALTNGRNGLGCVVVFSSGNSHSNVAYPANSNSDIIAVGAMSQCGQKKNPDSCDGEYWWGSCFGTTLDIMAPGVLIPTTDRQGVNGYNSASGTTGNYFQTFNGTSAACPHVAAVAGLILSVNPNLTQKQVGDIIESTAQKTRSDLYTYQTTSGRPNGAWNNEMGYGLLNAFAAVMTACPDHYNISWDINNGDDLEYQAANYITAQNTIHEGAIVSYHAGSYVQLTPGFHAEASSQFRAYIQGCGTVLKSSKINNTLLDDNEEIAGATLNESLNFTDNVSTNIKVYPNPTHDILFIDGLRDFETSIFDIYGKQVLNIGKANGSINISSLSPGIYMIRLKCIDKTYIEKIVKQ